MTDFERYVALYSGDLTRFCMKLCCSEHDAEDLFQDTWTRALDRIDKYDDSRNFKNWLFAICVNLFKSSGRSKYNTMRLSFSTDEEKERFFSCIPDESKDLDEYLSLYEALGTLDKKHRAVIILFYFKEFSQSEIAQILGVPEGTVKSRLNTAKKQLKRRLYDDAHD